MDTIDRHQKAYVCTQVFEAEKPVLLINRTDGDWIFLCGDDHSDNASPFRIVEIGHVLDADPTLIPVMDMAPDWEAERVRTGEPWIRNVAAPEE